MRFSWLFFCLFSVSLAEPQYTILDSSMMDIDKDKNYELMVLYTITDPDDANFGSPRELVFYKADSQGTLTPWMRSKSAVLDANAGGIMGDPFMGMHFDNDILNINHFGGSQIKWSYTDKYRFKDGKLILVEHTSKSFDGGCHFKELSYNLKTGDAVYTQNKNLQSGFRECEKDNTTAQAKGNFPRLQPITIENRHTFVPYEIMNWLERELYKE